MDLIKQRNSQLLTAMARRATICLLMLLGLASAEAQNITHITSTININGRSTKGRPQTQVEYRAWCGSAECTERELMGIGMYWDFGNGMHSTDPFPNVPILDGGGNLPVATLVTSNIYVDAERSDPTPYGGHIRLETLPPIAVTSGPFYDNSQKAKPAQSQLIIDPSDVFDLDFSNNAVRRNTVKFTVNLRNPGSSSMALSHYLQLPSEMYWMGDKAMFPGRSFTSQGLDFTALTPEQTWTSTGSGPQGITEHLAMAHPTGSSLIKMLPGLNERQLAISGAIEPHEQLSITFEAVVENEFPFSVHELTVDFGAIGGGLITQSTVPVSRSLDPNAKVASVGTPERSLAPGEDLCGEEYNFTIQIENIGTGKAYNIVAVDTLDATAFDMSTLTIKDVQMGYIPLGQLMQYNPGPAPAGVDGWWYELVGNVLTFTAQLPTMPVASTHDPVLSHRQGSFSFSVNTLCPMGTPCDSIVVAQNEASITFDANPPIVTAPINLVQRNVNYVGVQQGCFPTSCSTSGLLGMQAGPFTVVGWEDANGNLCDASSGGSCVCNGGITNLHLRYDGPCTVDITGETSFGGTTLPLAFPVQSVAPGQVAVMRGKGLPQALLFSNTCFTATQSP